MAIKCPDCQFENPSDSKFCKECGTQLTPVEDIAISPTKTLKAPILHLEIGSLFAERYKILGELGKGGMGEVYRVMDQKLDEEMALKLIKPEVAAEKGTIERFKNELKFARKIAHRNVCKMYDLHEEEDIPFITMEFVEGEDLKHKIKKAGKISEGEAIRIAKQVCEGLAEAHRLGVVHRDLKPQNIMIDRHGDTKIMDFGIARSVEAPGVTHTGMIIGTPDYISPEQAEGLKADERSDIYSLGVILYEMVTGQVPFQGDTALSVALKHKSQLPIDPRKLNPGISEDLSRLILVCMEKEKSRRYQTAEDLLGDLRNVEEGFPLGTKIKPRRKTFVASLIRKKLFFPSLAVALILIAVLIWQLLPKKEGVITPSGKPSLAVLFFENLSGDESLNHLRLVFPQLLIMDLSQSKYIRVLRLDEVTSVLEKLNLTEIKTYSLEDLKDITKTVNTNHLLKGSFIKVGDTYKIAATLIAANTTETLRSLDVEAAGDEEIYGVVDDLTLGIKANLGFTAEQLADDFDMEIGSVTTKNLKAMQYYIEGERYHNAYYPAKAIQSFEKAVDIDPEFAMAYRFLWACTGNRKYLQKAYQLRDHVSLRERYILEGDINTIDDLIQMDEIDYINAIEMYKKVVDIYPDDYLGNHMLNFMYANIGEWDLGIECNLRTIQNRTSLPMIYEEIVELYSLQGRYEDSLEIYEKALKNILNDDGLALAHETLARVHMQEGKYDLALAELKIALSMRPDPFIQADMVRCEADILFFKDNLDEALVKYQQLNNMEAAQWTDPWRYIVNIYVSQGRMDEAIDFLNNRLLSLLELKEPSKNKKKKRILLERLAWLMIKTGKFELAVGNLKKAYSLIEEDSPAQSFRKFNLFYQALAYIEMNRLEEALNTIEENKRVWPPIVKKSFLGDIEADIHFLIGKMALKKEKFEEAITEIEKAVSLLPGEIFDIYEWWYGLHALYMDSLAFAYFRNGNLDLAIATYEKIHDLTYGRFIWGDIYAKSFFMLGKIYEQKDWKGKAMESYEKFLDLWKEADPGHPEVEDASKRLDALKN